MGFLLGKEHAEADKGDDQAAGNTQTGNRYSEGVHHHLAGIPGDHQDGEHINRGHQRLTVTLGVVHIPGQAKEQRHGSQRVRQR